MFRLSWTSLVAWAAMGVVAPSTALADWKHVLHDMTDSTPLGCADANPRKVYVVPRIPSVPQPIVNLFDKHVFTLGTCKPVPALATPPRGSEGLAPIPAVKASHQQLAPIGSWRAPPALAPHAGPSLWAPQKPLPSSLGVLPDTTPRQKYSLGVELRLDRKPLPPPLATNASRPPIRAPR
jgi:hypothetical protein